MEIKATYELFAVERGEGYTEHLSADGPDFSLVARRVYHLNPSSQPDSAPTTEYVLHLTLPSGDHSWLSGGSKFQIEIRKIS